VLSLAGFADKAMQAATLASVFYQTVLAAMTGLNALRFSSQGARTAMLLVELFPAITYPSGNI
jgi:uncharacterized membrane protein